MPLAPPRVCPTCRLPVPAGQRCPRCRTAQHREEGRRRGGAQARGYTYAWQQQVKAQLRRTPYCWVCGATGTPDNPLTGDHVVPKSRGGQAVASNIRILCRLHNSRRGARGG